jgi:hypothetical protein
MVPSTDVPLTWLKRVCDGKDFWFYPVGFDTLDDGRPDDLPKAKIAHDKIRYEQLQYRIEAAVSEGLVFKVIPVEPKDVRVESKHGDFTLQIEWNDDFADKTIIPDPENVAYATCGPGKNNTYLCPGELRDPAKSGKIWMFWANSPRREPPR